MTKLKLWNEALVEDEVMILEDSKIYLPKGYEKIFDFVLKKIY